MKTKEKKQIKAIEKRVKKQLLDTVQKSIASLFSGDFLTEDAIFVLNKIVEIEQKFNRDNFIYKASDKKEDKTYYFQNFETLKSFGK